MHRLSKQPPALPGAFDFLRVSRRPGVNVTVFTLPPRPTPRQSRPHGARSNAPHTKPFLPDWILAGGAGAWGAVELGDWQEIGCCLRRVLHCRLRTWRICGTLCIQAHIFPNRSGGRTTTLVTGGELFVPDSNDSTSGHPVALMQTDGAKHRFGGNRGRIDCLKGKKRIRHNGAAGHAARWREDRR